MADAPGSLAGGRYALEVYPHAAMVGLFKLQRIVKYKKGPVAQKRKGLVELQQLLHDQLPKLRPAIAALPFEDPAPLRGNALKHLEDRLDSLVCPAMVSHFTHNSDDCLLPGSFDDARRSRVTRIWACTSSG